VLKIQTTSKKTTLKRRDFLSRSAAVGGMVILSASSGLAHALGTSTHGLLNPVDAGKRVRLTDATVKDFEKLAGQTIRLRTESGATVHAKLIEANSPKLRRGLRFRREPFSLVFDVQGESELVQGQYSLTHPLIGSMALFMVPVDLPAKHRRLEAVFS